MSVGYIYPHWIAAQRRLVEVIENRPPNSSIGVIVNEWFKRHCFEFGVSTSLDRELLVLNSNYDHMKAVKYKHGQMLAEKILEKGLFHRTHRQGLIADEITDRILVLGAPEIVGRGTRESGEERDAEG